MKMTFVAQNPDQVFIIDGRRESTTGPEPVRGSSGCVLPAPIWRKNPRIFHVFHAGLMIISPFWGVQTVSPDTSTLIQHPDRGKSEDRAGRGGGGQGVLSTQRKTFQAKAMGHQGSPLTEATSEFWARLTLVYRLSCPGNFTAGPELVPSPELESTDELTCK